MLSSLAHLALEVKHLGRARGFYVDRLGLDPIRETDAEVAFRVGDAALILRRPTGVPRGGLHVHYAFSAPKASYEGWRERLADLAPEEHEFGAYRSLYADDPDGHCVEIGDNADVGGGGAGAPALTDVFEIVLEVEALDPAVALYRDLGFEPYDRGESRRRVRLSGPFDLELWEPQLGIADARGGVHADVAFRVADPAAVVGAVADRVGEPRAVSVDGRIGDDGDGIGSGDGGAANSDGGETRGLRVRDPDGHYLTFLEE